MTDPRTDLRDARLHKALAHAPDRDALPAPGTRNTIKNIATGVISTRDRARFDTQIPWWKALWEKTGRAGRGGHASGPWNAAFATLLLGGIITLIWQGQEVPEAVPDQRHAGQRVPDAALPAPVVKPKEPTAAPAPTSTPMPAPTPETALAKAPQPSPPSEQRHQAAPAPSKAAVSKVPVSPAEPAPAAPTANLGAPAEPLLRREAPVLEKRESAAVGAPSADKSISDMAAAPQQAGKQGAAAAPSSPATAPAQSVAPDPATAVARAPEPSPAPAAAPARAAPYAAAAPAPSAPGAVGAVGSMAERIARNDGNNRSRRAMFPPAALTTADWVAADVLYQGRTIRLARPEAQNLVNRVLGLMAANPAAVPSARAADKAPATAAETTVETAVAKSGAEGGAPTLRLQLVDQNSPGAVAVPVAQLELRGTALRLQRAGQADVVGMLTPEALAGLLAEVVRALPP